MKYTRRDFIKFGGLAIGFLPGLAGYGFGRTALTPDTLSLQDSDSFQKLIGSQFTFYRENSATAATLTEVKTDRPARKKDQGECFSLVFELSADDFRQATYQVFHLSLGEFELFSVPGTSGKGTPLLIAVINRI